MEALAPYHQRDRDDFITFEAALKHLAAEGGLLLH